MTGSAAGFWNSNFRKPTQGPRVGSLALANRRNSAAALLGSELA
jgi:hypothetical protein